MFLTIHTLFGFGLVVLLLASFDLAMELLLSKVPKKRTLSLLVVGELLLLLAVVSGEVFFIEHGVRKLSVEAFAVHEYLAILVLMEYALFILWYMFRGGRMIDIEKKALGAFNILSSLLIVLYLAQIVIK